MNHQAQPAVESRFAPRPLWRLAVEGVLSALLLLLPILIAHLFTDSIRTLTAAWQMP